MSTGAPAITPQRVNFATPDTGARTPAANSNTPTARTPSATPGTTPSGLVDAITVELGSQCDDADLKLAELKRQNDIYVEKDENKREKLNQEFITSVLGASTLMPFVGMRGGYLRVVHTVQRYGGDYLGKGPLTGAIIGFVGDRIQTKNPLAVRFDDQFLEWTGELVMESELTLRAFFKDAAKRMELYSPGMSDSTTELELPPLLMVPRGMLPWLVETPRTPWEYREELLTQVGGDDPDKRPPALSLSLAWLSNQCLVGGRKTRVGGN